MKYLCLIYHAEAVINALSSEEYTDVVARSLAYVEELRVNGNHVDANALASVRTATTLRFGGSMVAATDGPFAETREQLGGYYLIEARDLNDAIRLASRIPSARYGGVEIRPIHDLLSGER